MMKNTRTWWVLDLKTTYGGEETKDPQSEEETVARNVTSINILLTGALR